MHTIKDRESTSRSTTVFLYRTFFFPFILNLSNCCCFPPLCFPTIYHLPSVFFYFCSSLSTGFLTCWLMFYSIHSWIRNSHVFCINKQQNNKEHSTTHVISFGRNTKKIWFVSIAKSMSDRKSLRIFKRHFPLQLCNCVEMNILDCDQPSVPTKYI